LPISQPNSIMQKLAPYYHKTIMTGSFDEVDISQEFVKEKHIELTGFGKTQKKKQVVFINSFYCLM